MTLDERTVVPQALVVVDDLVMCKNHQKRRELDTFVRITRDKHFFIKCVHACSSATNLRNRHLVEASVELLNVNLWLGIMSRYGQIRHAACRSALLNQRADSKVSIIDSHLEDAGKFLASFSIVLLIVRLRYLHQEAEGMHPARCTLCRWGRILPMLA